MHIKKLLLPLFYIVALTVIVDQISKFSILYLSPRILLEENIFILPILPILNITLVWNYGISFGIFNDAAQSQILLLVMSATVSFILLFIYIKKSKQSLRYPIGMIVGGALGNCADRLIYGAVLDFIDFHAFGYHYPSFNIADSAIVVGAFLLMINKDF